MIRGACSSRTSLDVCIYVVLALDFADVPGSGSFFLPPLALAVVHLLCFVLGRKVKENY